MVYQLMPYVQNMKIYGNNKMTDKYKLQIVIPMTGYGSRFAAAGYDRLKPFIKVQGKTMIEWVVSMFPENESDIIFICRQEHLDTLDYFKPELERIAPNAKIFAIDNWDKKGPVVDVLRANSVIDDTLPTFISYCDYFMVWNWQNVKTTVIDRGCDGYISTYSGFHPNLVPPKNLYASCLVDDNEDLIEIREKYSFTENKEHSRHSPGLYYFKTGALMKHYYQKNVDNPDDSINGEFYSSTPYNYLVNDGLKVYCPVDVQYFCQWGTPEDLEEFNFYVNHIKKWSK